MRDHPARKRADFPRVLADGNRQPTGSGGKADLTRAATLVVRPPPIFGRRLCRRTHPTSLGGSRSIDPEKAHMPAGLGASGTGHVSFGPSLSAPLARLCLRRLRRFTWVGRTTRPWSPTAAVLAVAISARAPIATLAGEDTLSRGLRTPPLPATHASVGDCWQNSRCHHLLLEEQHTSRDALVSHAAGPKR